MHRRHSILVLVLLPLLAAGCFSMRGSHGGGQTSFDETRRITPSDVALPDGYRIEPVAEGFTFPTGVAFDAAGTPYVVESGYSYGEVWDTPRLLRVAGDGSVTEVARGDNNGPWNGVAYHDGAFFVAEGGQREGGRILRITPAGEVTPIVENLPSLGDHHTNGPAVGPDGRIYFGQGTATNSGVVGLDSAQFGWLHRYPEFHDIPCRDITLTGKNYTTRNPLRGAGPADVSTGAFVPFGTATRDGQVIRGRIPCNGAILRVRPDGSNLELVAWGLRNPFGLAFSPDGRLFVTENSYDDRGSRPVFGTGDLLREVQPGKWHGWPDYFAHIPMAGSFAPPGKDDLVRLMKEWPNDPPKAAAKFAVHSSSNGLDFDGSGRFGPRGLIYVAQFGDMAPGVGKVLNPAGFKVVRVDPGTGVIEDFAVNRGEHNGPASMLGTGGLERPVAVRFHPSGNAMYVVDFGVMTVSDRGPSPKRETGVLWKITRR
ncbi:MAG: glucose dehydrogenase [Acidobacteria bacterium]|nr:glucose dehydrogenase [Acidobacteriota bacterium]